MSRCVGEIHPQAAGVVQRSPVSATGLLGASVLLLSSAWPLTKRALELGASPLWFAEGRAVLSGIVAFAVLGVAGRLSVPRRADLPSVLGVGLLQLAGFFTLVHAAVAWVPAGRTAILANTTTIFVLPLSVVLLGERIGPRRWLAAAIGLAGVIALMGPWAIDWTDRAAMIGHAFLLGAALSWSLAMIVIRRTPPHSSMLQILPWCFALASLAMLPLVLVEAPHGGYGPHPAAWASLAFIGLLAGPVGTWCVMQATATLPMAVSSVGFLATPAAGLILSNLMLGERLTPDLLFGSALILGGVGLAAWPPRRRRPA
jgi:O-acetylserine/cysteine efflux transporter